MERDELILLGDLNYIEAMRDQTRACGGTIIEEEGLCMMLGPAPHPILNVLVRLDDRSTGEECIEEAHGLFEASRHGFTLILRNSADDSDVREAALKADLVPLLSPPEMILEERLAPPELADDVVIRVVEDAAGLAAFIDVAADAWTTYGIAPEVTQRTFASGKLVGAPHVRAVVAYLEGRPASCALVNASHGVAGLYWISTVRESRSRGLGEACTRVVTNLAFDLGARAVSLQASPMGEPIYRRIGFEQIATYELLAALEPGS
ncbi:MAG: GNAT family N-acetyltransferase [Myxococcales bacterium]|nr:MAG: GNAT family N-acetyltransferase [Myxococcales bacterium]